MSNRDYDRELFGGHDPDRRRFGDVATFIDNDTDRWYFGRWAGGSRADRVREGGYYDEGDWEQEGGPEYPYARGSYPHGRFSGRGPRNYRRSDDRIREDINDRLTDHPEIDPTDVDVQVSNGEVTLQGNVDSRYARRLIEDVAWTVRGVQDVFNRLTVEQYRNLRGKAA